MLLLSTTSQVHIRCWSSEKHRSCHSLALDCSSSRCFLLAYLHCWRLLNGQTTLCSLALHRTQYLTRNVCYAKNYHSTVKPMQALQLGKRDSPPYSYKIREDQLPTPLLFVPHPSLIIVLTCNSLIAISPSRFWTTQVKIARRTGEAIPTNYAIPLATFA